MPNRFSIAIRNNNKRKTVKQESPFDNDSDDDVENPSTKNKKRRTETFFSYRQRDTS